ncbi:GDP-L-fucose synthase family protein [Prochlorococcus marinus]|uniref:GDP-L-fucose synthase family protein n=1 Tax=Prochlorococcus marinus TaxID=1219 RepID=UPI00094D76B4|nr:GDP-L-fucose synthase [Prochlorococcus marinus]
MNKKIEKSERIFIAGANGMVGKSIKRSLIKLGYGLKENKGSLLTPSRKELNLLDYKEVQNWFIKNKPTIVILAAAKVGGIQANNSMPADFILENLKIQNNVIENSWKTNVKRFLFLGSSCIYPKFAKQPLKEEYLLDGQLEKTNEWYAIAKIAGLKLCNALRNQYGFDAISLMPTNLYGPGDNYHPENSHVMAALISKFSKASLESSSFVECWGSGTPLREFLHVDDLGDAAVFCLENWHPSSVNSPKDEYGVALNHLNIGTGKDISIRQLAIKIAEFCEFKGEIIWDKTKPDGTPKKQLDISKISQLGWSPKIELDDGIKQTILLYKKLIKN